MTTATGSATPTATNRRGTQIVFDLSRPVPLDPERAWRALTDWEGHGRWVPMTRVEVDPDDPNRFTAWSGVWRLALEDRMLADVIEFDGTNGHCHVHKLGPVLIGEAEFWVSPGDGAGTCVVRWREDVRMRFLPRFLARPAAWLGRRLFLTGLKRMAKTA